MVKQRTVVAVLGGALVLSGASLAPAHVGSSPQTVNRYVWVLVHPKRVEVKLDLIFGELPAGEERTRTDTNGDGELDAAEVKAAGERWAKQLPELARVEVDGRHLPWDGRAEVDLAGRTAVGGHLLQVGGSAARDVDAATHRVRVELRKEPPRAGESEIRLETGSGWELVSSRRGAGPNERGQRFEFAQPRVAAVEDRSVEFVVRRRADVPAAGDGATGRTVALLLGLAAFAAGFAAIRTRIRRQKAAGGAA